MTLPVSPNSISLSQVNTELGLTSTATISLNDTAVRALFGRTSGTISMSDGWGKSDVIIIPTLATPSFSTATGGINQVSFEWSSIPNATSYDVTFNGVTTNQTSTTFTKSSVAASTYNFTVVAKAPGYNNSPAAVVSNIVVTDPLPTLATPAFTAAVGGVNQVSFTWTSVANATSYDVTFNGVTTNQTSTTFTKSSVSAGDYQCAVSAKASGYNNSSTTVSAVVTVTALVIPGTVTLTTSDIKSTTARITATTSSGGVPTNFHLFREINGTNTFIRSAANGIFDLYDMTPETTYGPYRSYAENAAGISAYWSNDVDVTTTATPTFTPVSTTASEITNADWYTYSYTAPVTRTYTFTATGFDTQISFNDFTTFTDLDSQPGSGEQVTYAMTAGQSVTVSVRAWSGSAGGTLSFSIT
jgi:hypothetical protein